MKEKTMKASLTLILLILSLSAFSRPSPHMREADKVRIAEAQRLARLYTNEIWDGMGDNAFTVLLIEGENEFLINHPAPDTSFRSLGVDSLLGSEVFVRSQRFPPNFLATFPAVNGRNCIVVGTPEQTGLPSTAWIITLLHEYFHIHQYTQPNYYQWAADLDLAKGDESGMWMLNFPFPYENEEVQELIYEYQSALSRPDFSLEEFLHIRNTLKENLSRDDYTYFSFQLWQEGVARYTEYAFLKNITEDQFQSSLEVQALEDFESYESYYQTFVEREKKLLKELKLGEFKRVAFYSYGLAEAWMLDIFSPDWKKKYFTHPFQLGKLFQED
ncbi:MAG: hypothetical protein AAFR66_01475 [Bacteroidota bacterium]